MKTEEQGRGLPLFVWVGLVSAFGLFAAWATTSVFP